jgi:hypothetical protein
MTSAAAIIRISSVVRESGKNIRENRLWADVARAGKAPVTAAIGGSSSVGKRVPWQSEGDGLKRQQVASWGSAVQSG